MRVAYGKMGRSLTLDPSKYGFQGDAEAPQLLERLARRNPDVTWVIIGRTSNEGSIDLPNVENSWLGIRDEWRARTKGMKQPYSFHDKLAIQQFIREAVLPIWSTIDAAVIHAGQHGTSSIPIPVVGSTWAQFVAEPGHHPVTQDWAVAYASPVIAGLNRLGDQRDGKAPVSWIVTDPRNYLKDRSIKWPSGCDDVLAQYQFTRTQKHDRFLDPRSPQELNFDAKAQRGGELWLAKHAYRYGGLELMILPDDWATWGSAGFDDRLPAGIATTSFRSYTREPRRSELVRDVLLATFPGAEIFGKWDKISLADVPDGLVQLNEPRQFPELLNRWRVTLALPALGGSWTAAKPFQCWAANVACFMYGRLDDQGWILPTRLPKPLGHGKAFAATHEIAPGLYSIRDDWTEMDLQLARWLRVSTPDEFTARAKVVAQDWTTWQALVNAQRDLLRRRWDEAFIESEIERRLGL